MSDDLNQPTPPPPQQQQTAEQPPYAPQPNVGYQPPRPACPYAPPYASPYGTPYAAPGFYPPRKPRSAWFWPVILLGSLLILGLLLWAMIWAAMHISDDGASPAFASSRIAVIDV